MLNRLFTFGDDSFVYILMTSYSTNINKRRTDVSNIDTRNDN